MKIPRMISAIALGLLAISSVPQSRAELARFIQVVKVDDADTRFHLGELEAFENGVVPMEYLLELFQVFLEGQKPDRFFSFEDILKLLKKINRKGPMVLILNGKG